MRSASLAGRPPSGTGSNTNERIKNPIVPMQVMKKEFKGCVYDAGSFLAIFKNVAAETEPRSAMKHPLKVLPKKDTCWRSIVDSGLERGQEATHNIKRPAVVINAPVRSTGLVGSLR